jgi:mitochondrial fission protein ELM1
MRAQGFGLVERAGLAGRLCPVRVRPGFSLFPAAYWPAPLLAVARMDVKGCGMIAAVGGKSAAVAAALRRPDRPVVQIQNPRMRLDRFDLVVANHHDEIAGPNVVLSRTAMHGVTPQVLASARAQWAQRLAHLPRPLVAVLMGGSNGRFRLDETVAGVLAQGLREVMQRDCMGLVLTPSRRTDPQARAVLDAALTPLGAWVWDMQGENPYLGLIACADAIIVTIDSVSMISEAVASAAPVYVAGLPGGSRRIELFVRTLMAAGRVRMFDGWVRDWPVAPLDDTAMAAHEMRHRLGLGA